MTTNTATLHFTSIGNTGLALFQRNTPGDKNLESVSYSLAQLQNMLPTSETAPNYGEIARAIASLQGNQVVPA